MSFIIVILKPTVVGTDEVAQHSTEVLYFTLQGLTTNRSLATTFQSKALAQGVAERYNSAYNTMRAHVEEVP